MGEGKEGGEEEIIREGKEGGEGEVREGVKRN